SALFVSPAPREEVAYVTCTYRNTGIDQPDFLATVDLNPRSCHYGQVIHRLPMPNLKDELHCAGWAGPACGCFESGAAAKRTKLVLPGLISSRIYVVDVGSQCRAPRICKMIEPVDVFWKCNKGYLAVSHALPNGDILIANTGDPAGNGKGGFVVLDGATLELKGNWESECETPASGYDFWYQARLNVLVSSAGLVPKVAGRGFSPEDFNKGIFGRRLNVWNLSCRSLTQCFDLGEDSLPLTVRFLHRPDAAEGYVGCALSGAIFRFYKPCERENWAVEEVIRIPAKDVSGWIMPKMPGSCGFVRVRAGSCGFVRVRAGSCGFVRVRAGSCGFVRVRAGSCGFVRVRAGSCGFVRVRAGSCGFVRVRAGSCGFVRVRAGSCGFVRVRAGSCGFVRVRAGSCGFVRVRAGSCGFVRVRAGSCGFVRVRAGSCGFVRVRAGSCGFVRVRAGSCGFVRVRAGSCGFVRSGAAPGTVFVGGSILRGGPVTVCRDEELKGQPEPLVVKCKRVFGGPASLQLSLDGKRLYVTNSFYSTWDRQFYPSLIKEGSVLLQLDVDTDKGGLAVNKNFLVDFGKEPHGPCLAHAVRFPGGDCKSEPLA
ncbi:PREDICTED: selenium-binding protein 1, partial [Ficedula albicollis]|uniref:selenium-binding protein 1 n=1 Tax=Ficedula albicollis TaxID=59894 RepID=UPI0007AD94A6